MSNNEIVAAGSYYSDQFEFINKELRQHVKLANNEIENVKDKVNELVVIVHDDNPDWSRKKICDYIAGKNDDLEEYGFSSKTIERYLTEENRNKLVDNSRDSSKSKKGKKLQNNVMEPDVDNCPHHLLEDSSIGDKEQQQQEQYQPSSELEEFRKQHGEKIKDIEIEFPLPPDEESDTTTYDKDFVEGLIKENAELKQKLEKFIFEYPIEMTDEILSDIKRNNGIFPLVATAYPLKNTGIIRFDRSRLKK